MSKNVNPSSPNAKKLVADSNHDFESQNAAFRKKVCDIVFQIWIRENSFSFELPDTDTDPDPDPDTADHIALRIERKIKK
jgi:hypothetical protein